MPRSTDIEAIDRQIDHLTLAHLWRPEAGLPAASPATFDHIVVGVDGSEAATNALAWARRLATPDVALHLVAVLGPPPYSYDYGSGTTPPVHGSYANWQELMDEDRKEAERILQEAADGLKDGSARVTTEVAFGSPGSKICHIAEERGADLVIVGTHQAGLLERMILGSVSDEVKNGAHTNVLVAKSPPQVRGVVAPVDGSPQSRVAAFTAIALGDTLGIPVTILHVVPGPSYGPVDLSRAAYEKSHTEMMANVTDAAAVDHENVRFELEHGAPAKEILRFVEAHPIDLVVMGSRGLGGLKSRMLGSISGPVAHKSDASLLLIKERPE